MEHTIEYLKRQAKKLKKESNISHAAALTIIAQQQGYANWMHLISSNTPAKNNGNART